MIKKYFLMFSLQSPCVLPNDLTPFFIIKNTFFKHFTLTCLHKCAESRQKLNQLSLTWNKESKKLTECFTKTHTKSKAMQLFVDSVAIIATLPKFCNVL